MSVTENGHVYNLNFKEKYSPVVVVAPVGHVVQQVLSDQLGSTHCTRRAS